MLVAEIFVSLFGNTLLQPRKKKKKKKDDLKFQNRWLKAKIVSFNVTMFEHLTSEHKNDLMPLV